LRSQRSGEEFEEAPLQNTHQRTRYRGWADTLQATEATSGIGRFNRDIGNLNYLLRINEG
jgi:hypothetical protein